MALLLSDGFGLYNTAAGALDVKGWTMAGGVGSGSFGTGRVSTSRFVNLSGSAVLNATRLLPAFSGATSLIGCAVRVNAFAPLATADVVSMSVGGSAVRLVAVTATGGFTLNVYKDSTLVATLPGTYALDVWYYPEVKVTWATSATVVVRVDGSEMHNAAMALAAPTAGLTVGLRNAFSGAGVISFTDVLIMDGTGSTFNDFQGDVMIETLFPTADGANSGWTQSTGATHFGVVDESPFHNSDADYVTTSTVNALDTYAMQNLATTAGSAVLAVRPHLVARKESAAVMGIAPTVRSAGTNYPGTARDLANTLTYTAESDTLTVDPATSTAWTRAAVDALEVGPKKTA